MLLCLKKLSLIGYSVVILTFSEVIAADPTLKSIRIALVEPTYQLSVQFKCTLGPTLEEALTQGVPLNFILEIQLKRPRFYWFSTTLMKESKRYALSYHALTRQYRLNIGSIYQNYPQLSAALNAMCTLSGQTLIERSVLSKDETLTGSLRLWLDSALLPKPFQISVLTSADWRFDSGEQPFTLAHEQLTP